MERKLLYAFGAIIIAGIIAVGSFSLGVYIGEQGWTLRPPSVTGPAKQPAKQPDGQPPGAPADARPSQPQQARPPQPDLIGRVVYVDADALLLDTKEGRRSVLLNDETRLVRLENKQEKPAEREMLQRGTIVAVFGKFDDSGHVLTAQHLVILPPPK